MYKLCFYVPEDHLEEVKESILSKGAGKIGNYSNCCWQTLGEGQFQPLEGSNPYSGKQGRLKRVKEYKVEALCSDNIINEVVNALKQIHPYETPVYYMWKIESF